MFILYAVVAGLLVGLLAGGRPANLAALQIRWPGLIAAGLVAQLVLFSDPVAQRVGDLGPALYVGSTVLVIAAVARNLPIAGMPVVLAGAIANLTAVVANGGSMPASHAALEIAGRLTPRIYSNSSAVTDPALWPLTDVFALPSWVPLANVFSVGDVMIGAGIAVVIVLALRRRAPARSGAPTH
jgi:hypothetical protein